ncbi:TIGR02117 family protein [Sphingorhabdus sp. Alg239-R122]|uniref:TIGR02117 family protein n=1 Tax=Sphingorhabdus sp. Alg239-R122 TaxID=2305989 RepID=UPI0019680361|nr:TIGR02117 family protein [Sphingorhabdus sp. Alg239-R122]
MAALAGSLIGVNANWREPGTGVQIFVETNGVHTALVLPKRAAGHDWSAMVSASHLRDPSLTGDYLSFSWGHRQFYLETQSWDDIKAPTLANVILGSDETLVHVYHLTHVQEGRYSRALTITEQQYQQLAELIEDKFLFNADGGQPTPIPGYGDDDIFYEATGRYTIINTCNTWTGDMLEAIGVRVGAWTPLAGGVMRWFPQKTDNEP